MLSPLDLCCCRTWRGEKGEQRSTCYEGFSLFSGLAEVLRFRKLIQTLRVTEKDKLVLNCDKKPSCIITILR